MLASKDSHPCFNVMTVGLLLQGTVVAYLFKGTMVAPIHVALSQCRLSFSEVTMGKKLIYRPLDKKTVSSLGKSMHFDVHNFFHALPYIYAGLL